MCASPRASTTPELTAQELPRAGGSSPSAGPHAIESDGPSPAMRPASKDCSPTLRLRTWLGSGLGLGLGLAWGEP